MKDDYEQKMINYVRGKTAGSDVFDQSGSMLISRGDVIDNDTINMARQRGLLQVLVLSAVSAIVNARGEEADRRLKEFRDITENHEADFVRGEKAGRDVTDVQGNTIVEAGQKITDGIIECARRQNMLQDLVLAVGAPGIDVSESAARQNIASKMGYDPFPSGEQPGP